jgi:hypothetical protein
VTVVRRVPPVGDDHHTQGHEECSGERAEAQDSGYRRCRQDRSDGDHGQCGQGEGRLGRLRKKRHPAGADREDDEVWVAKDSTNQPDRNSTAPACKTTSITAKVAKSNSELSGPKTTMKRLMKAMSQGEGRRSRSSSTSSVGMASWLVSRRLLSRI